MIIGPIIDWQRMKDHTQLIHTYLNDLRSQGKSCPNGKYWDRLFRFIIHDLDQDDLPGNPLILGGSIASHTVKHERLREHLEFAASHGRLFSALNILENLPETAWNTADPDIWSDEHPWAHKNNQRR